MRINGLFWNVGGADRAQLIAKAAAERELDIVVLAESDVDVARFLAELEAGAGTGYFCPHSEVMRLQIFSRSQAFGLEEIYGSINGRLTVRTLVLDGFEFLFAAMHLASKRYWDPLSQQVEVQSLADEIRDVEQRQGHRRTILVGDLNVNPFEHGVVAAAGLHAMMTKADIAKGSRVVQDKEYPFFYNPMWGLFGDRTPGPAGSYYYRGGEQISYDWNLFDQLLLRPDALQFVEEKVELLTTISGVNLASELGRPNRAVGSDHFPLFFCINSVGTD
jgi:hypothetical protein